MKKEHNYTEVYESPQIEVIDIEVEQNIMAGSADTNDAFLLELNDMEGEDW